MSYFLIQKYTAPSAVTTITLNTLPTTYKHLRLFTSARTTSPSIQRPIIAVALNGDSTNSNYIQFDWYLEDSTTTFGQEWTTSTNKTRTVGMAGSNSYASAGWHTSETSINSYNEATKYKTLYTRIAGKNTSTNWDNWQNGVLWKNTSAITSISLTLDAGDFHAGSVVCLYGLD